MDSNVWTWLSGLLVSISGIYYAVLVYRREAPCNPISWAAWGIVGVAIFLTSETTFGMNAITFGAINPFAVAAIGAWRQLERAETPTRREIVSGLLALIAIGAWIISRTGGYPSEWILGLSIAADMIPLWPILVGAWTRPQDDKPFAWLLFGVGFGISSFGLHEISVFTLAVPAYMFVGSMTVALPLASYRWQRRAPIREWA